MLGFEVPEFMSIEPMLVTADVQSHNPINFDCVALVHRLIDLALMGIKKNPSKMYFNHYSILMHMILYYGYEKGMWLDEFKIRQLDQEGEPLLV